MKILIVNPFYYPNMVGGTEHSVKLLAEGLKNNKNEVIVFTIDNLKTKNIIMDNIEGIKVYRSSGGLFNTTVRLHKKNNIFNKILNKFVELNNNYVSNQFSKVIDEFKPNVIHVNNLYGLSPKILKVAYQKKINIVYTIRDYWLLYPKGEIMDKNNLLIKLYQNYLKKYSNYVDYVTAPSKFTLDMLLNNEYFKNSKHMVVPNTINIDINKLERIISSRKKENSSRVSFIYAGMLEEKKGIINLLEAFSNIKNDNLMLIICGEGSLKEIVKNYCKKDTRIRYLGQLPNEKLNDERIKSDVAIVPSIWDEPFGRVVIEANQYGLPVIGSNRGGILEILNNIKTGELFQYDNISDLQDKINYFSDRKNIKKYYENILNNINYYSLQRQIMTFENIYKYLTEIKKGE